MRLHAPVPPAPSVAPRRAAGRLAALLVALGAAVGCAGEDTAADGAPLTSAATTSHDVPRPVAPTTPSADAPSASTPDTGATSAPDAPEGSIERMPEPTGPDVATFDHEIPTGDVDASASDVFVVNDDGALFWHPGLAGDDPSDPIQISLAPAGNEIVRVAGVHDGTVVFTHCCAPAAVSIAGVAPDAHPAQLATGRSADLGPDGELAVVDGRTLSIIDLDARTVRTREFGDDGEQAEIVDVWWGPGGLTLLVREQGVHAVAVVEPDSLHLRARTDVAEGDANVELAGSGPDGEIVVAVTSSEDGELRAYDVDQLRRIPELTRTLPPGVRSVRTTREGAVLWIDGNTLWLKHAAESRPSAVGAGSAAAWFVDR